MPNSVKGERREMDTLCVSKDSLVDRRNISQNQNYTVPEEIIEISDEDYDAESEEDSISVASNTSESEGASIYLRVRPLGKGSMNTSYKISGNVLVTTSADSSVINSKNQMEKHFTFSEIFDNDIDQATVFEKCVRNKIISEENFIVLTYGTSNSGKTHTLLGDVDQPGIIPRAIENIFTLYDSNLCVQPTTKLVNGNVVICDDDTMRKEILLRQNIISSCNDYQSMYARVKQQIQLEHEFQNKKLDNTSIFIWVSFAEIYNECVYDLLSSSEPSRKTTRLNHKIISNDGNVFIKDLTNVHVKQAVDAYKLLLYGQKKAQYAATAVNANSSRSHCIFFIDIIKHTHPDLFTVTSYKFCDLAGSERLGKTQNVGCRLKEAQRINTSLMVLGRCLDVVNNNQTRKNTEVIPYRESKLTMLLQSALQGREKLCMVVNISASDAFYEENMNVLSFASIAKNIVYKPLAVKKERSSRYSWFLNQSIMDMPAKHDSAQNNILLEQNLELRKENDKLLKRISQLEKNLEEQEHTIRNQLVNKFQDMLKDINLNNEVRTTVQMEMLKNNYERKISVLEAELARAKEDSYNSDSYNDS